MSITSALKKLAKNVFNVNTTGDNIDEILDDIANNASSSGGGGSGAGGLVVNARYDNEKYILDKTFGELYDAYASGTMIIVHTVYNNPEAPDSDNFEYVKELHTDYDTYSGKWSASVGSYAVDSQNTVEEMRNSYPYMTE